MPVPEVLVLCAELRQRWELDEDVGVGGWWRGARLGGF